MLKTTNATAQYEVVGQSTGSTSSPAEAVIQPNASLLLQEVKASIQGQYLAAAERGEISKIRAWRVVRGIDQSTLAERAMMTQPEVSRAERPGQAERMKGETLRRIARALQVRVDDLL